QGVDVKTNSWGMRAPELEKKKDAGTVRVAGLGDSIMFGWGVNVGTTYLNILQQKLGAALGKKVEVLNFGVPGYNTAMEAALLEHRAIEFEPDLILLQFVNNDWDVPAFMLQQEDPWDLTRSFLFDFIKERLSHGISIGSKQLKSVYDVSLNHSESSKQ